MDRRGFVGSVLAVLALLPLMGWLSPSISRGAAEAGRVNSSLVQKSKSGRTYLCVDCFTDGLHYAYEIKDAGKPGCLMAVVFLAEGDGAIVVRDGEKLDPIMIASQPIRFQ